MVCLLYSMKMLINADIGEMTGHDAEIMPRYEAAFPPALLPRVRASLTRLIELALEIDNGRYPSLPRFLDQLTRLRRSEQTRIVAS